MLYHYDVEPQRHGVTETLILVPPAYEGGGEGVVGDFVRFSNPLFHLPLHKGEKLSVSH
jgi:hypothetical protein